jgi:undecaprenyl-diphosphatase
LIKSVWESFDTALFYWINGRGQNVFFDWFMPFITDLRNFTYVLLGLSLWVLWKERKAGVVFLVFVILTLSITDLISSDILKDWVGRVRPCHVLTGVHKLAGCNTSYSFPSSHAVNIFAAAFFLAPLSKRLALVVYAIAALVGYSRVYIGIHYPTDVIGGASIGLLIAWPLRRLKDYVVDRFALKTLPPEKKKVFEGTQESK